MAKKPKKIRTEFRKNRATRARERNLTRRFHEHEEQSQDEKQRERISGKGELTRKRTIVGESLDDENAGLGIHLNVDETACVPGRVISVRGLLSDVQAADGTLYRCATRRLLKTIHTDQRHVVATGDRVLLRPSGNDEGIIERIEPRSGVLSRASRGRQHVIVTNVDQLLIVTSAAEPEIKPHLIDRLLVSAEKSAVRPVICVNKVDLVDPAELQPTIGVFGQMGYDVLLLSTITSSGIDRLKHVVRGKQNVMTGQSGVGKSSLLNAIQAGLNLKVREVSSENEKGRHTTTTARLIPLDIGGWIVDTPGIRQFQLWDVIQEEIAGFFRDIRPYDSLCRFPDCTHTHEADCSVKDAVADGRLDSRRYDSYCRMHAGDMV